MTTCTCPTTYDDKGTIVRAYLDAGCPVHSLPVGTRHCPTCQCGQVPIVQTPATAAEISARVINQAEVLDMLREARSLFRVNSQVTNSDRRRHWSRYVAIVEREIGRLEARNA